MSLTKLNSLKLSYNRISDVTPLADMPYLNKLYLRGNIISEISPLLHIEWLKLLEIENNPLDLRDGSQALKDIRELNGRNVSVGHDQSKMATVAPAAL